MLTEEDVVDAVCDCLGRHGYRVDQRCRTTQHGVDIIATQWTSGVTVRIEAKGETSNKKGTRRHGKPFSRNQSRVHVAAALYTAIATRDAHTNPNDRAAIAFPTTKEHRDFIGRIRPTLQALGIAVFWVDQDRRVKIEAPWRE
jgi:hypothetical protein